MKHISSFVTNSSSVSFILEIPKTLKPRKEVLKTSEDVLMYCNEIYGEDLSEDFAQEVYSKLLTIVNRGNYAMFPTVEMNGCHETAEMLENLGISVEIWE